MKKTRAVAYIRVSTERDAQLHSYEFQEHYWQSAFEDDPNTDLIGIYADATCIIGTNQSPSKRAAICPYFSYFQSIWRRHTL